MRGVYIELPDTGQVFLAPSRCAGVSAGISGEASSVVGFVSADGFAVEAATSAENTAAVAGYLRGLREDVANF